MPIGDLVPDTPTEVTPDASPARYSSFFGPAPNGPVIADDVLAVIQLALNIQDFLKSKTIDHWVIDLATLQAVSTAQNNEPYLVVGFGWYTYSATTVMTVESPWVLDATGMGAGQWISVHLLSLFTHTTPQKLIDSLLPYWQTVKSDSIPVDTYVEFLFSSATYIGIQKHGGGYLIQSITGVDTGDRIKIKAGPFAAALSSGDGVFLNVKVTQGGNVSNHERQVIASEVLFWDFVFESTSATNLTIGFDVKNDGSHTSAINLGAGMVPRWGIDGEGYDYFSYEVQRKF